MMKQLYISTERSPEARCVVSGLYQTGEGPEQIFVIRMSEPAAQAAMSAWLNAARQNDYDARAINQGRIFSQEAAVYASRYGLFARTEPTKVTMETHKGTPPPAPKAPAAPEPATAAPPVTSGLAPAASGIGQEDGNLAAEADSLPPASSPGRGPAIRPGQPSLVNAAKALGQGKKAKRKKK